MNPVVQGWATIAEGFGQRLDAVTPEQWEAKTPCTDWTVRDLVEHAIGVQQQIGGAVGAEVGEGLEDDPAAQWSAMRASMQSAFSAEGTLEKVIDTPFGQRPVAEALGLPMNDLLIHTWDLARSIGADESLPEQIVSHAYEALQPMDAMIRQPGMFGTKVEVPDDADLQTKFIAFTGRQP